MEREKNKNARTVSSSGVFFGGFPEFVPNRREEVAGNNPKFRLSARHARRAALPDRDVEARTLRRRLGSIFPNPAIVMVSSYGDKTAQTDAARRLEG